MVREVVVRPVSGWGPLLITAAGFIAGPALMIAAESGALPPWFAAVAILLILITVINTKGFIAVAPNDARVLMLFGAYRGSVKESGFYWVNPFYTRRQVSLRIRNFETGGGSSGSGAGEEVAQAARVSRRKAGRPSKVNDRDGNPVDISAVVVWRVVETAEALLEVEDYEHYVEIQSESALRKLASRHPYDSEDHEISLRGNTDEVCDQLRDDIQARLSKAGVEVIEARISHLAYSPEIAAAMLKRQQASAVIAARMKIVEGAVGIVGMALTRLGQEGYLDLDPERRAAMVSNLLVVLCGEAQPQPVINTGSLYQ
ncbi:MAG: SPFH domain-containing protein [Gemmatimonadota bacterium]|jgi:regulator of protease activity HflC (stomatin/prohibitin superfamily)|nr:SPFH domain-containing protein [Gemmatimonadota bacterium]